MPEVGLQVSWASHRISKVSLSAKQALGTGRLEQGMMGALPARGNQPLVREVSPQFPVKANSSTPTPFLTS